MLQQMQLRLIPSVTVGADRAGPDAAVGFVRPVHHVAVEANAFGSMHDRIHPQRSRDMAVSGSRPITLRA